MDAKDADAVRLDEVPGATGAGGRTRARDPLADALAELRDEHPRVPREPADRYWLRMGLGLGLRRPGRAQLLLERLEHAAGIAGAPAPDGAAEDSGEATARRAAGPDERSAGSADREDVDAAGTGQAAGDEGDGPVPLRSMLLARSASLPEVDKASFDPEAVFGWAARLTRDEVMWMGRIVGDMLDAGLSHDLAKGFGITWRAGLKLPDSDFRDLFHAFTELEVTVSSVLAGYDVRATPQEASQGWLTAALGSLFTRGDNRVKDASGILERAGEPAQRGLVAMWNAWAAVRYRGNLPDALFEQLVRPWVTVVGVLPEP
jgi:hypothetical protein